MLQRGTPWGKVENLNTASSESLSVDSSSVVCLVSHGNTLQCQVWFPPADRSEGKTTSVLRVWLPQNQRNVTQRLSGQI
jgi:hypothetical protein